MEHARVIDLIGGYRAVAAELNLAPPVVWRWGRTRSIPARRWGWVISEAKRCGVPGVTLESLALADQVTGAERQRQRDSRRRAERRAAKRAERDSGKGGTDSKAAA
jgi:hypothetical protein